MNASADYESAVKLLRRQLPAYVTYTARTHAKVFGSFERNDTRTLVVRVSDGKIIKGKQSPIVIQGQGLHNNVIASPPFETQCYRADGVRLASYDGSPAEAIALKPRCAAKGENDFNILYINPTTHEPLAVTGAQTDGGAAVKLEERFAHAGNYVLPASFDVSVKGSGFLFWLNVVAHQDYSRYSFSANPPK